MFDFALDIYLKSKDKSFDKIFMALEVFKHILKNNLMDFNYSEIYKLTLIKLKERIIDRESKNKINEILKDEDQLENMCRRMAVKIYFDSL
jgi:DNA replicative helicase MCM subunit Mcm2 (Cdc46/Mcm family)